MFRLVVVISCLLAAIGGCSEEQIARRDTLRRVIEEDDARRIAYTMAETMRCAQMDVLAPGQVPARPYRIIEASVVHVTGLREAESAMRQHACQMGADVVLDLRQQDATEPESGPRDVSVAVTRTGVNVRTPNRNISVGLGAPEVRYVATLAVYTDAATIPRGVVSLDLVGPAANPVKAERCIHAINAIGTRVSPSAPVRAILRLSDDDNRLKVVTQRGVILDEPRPDWRMDRLCQNAAVTALQAFGRAAK